MATVVERVLDRAVRRVKRPGSVLGIIATLLVTSQAAAAPAAEASSRQQAVDVVRELRRIVTPDGVDRSQFVRIGGIDQFVSIRNADRRNPILLILHGGPGFPTAPLAWWTTRGLEEYFTVVHWDQRGAGKTHLANGPKAVAPTMKPERFVDDTEELALWLRREFGKDKLFVLGTSWGSYVGLEFARRRPQWLHAYIGMGQLANSPESERRGYAAALAAARKAGNAEAIAELERIAPYAAPGRPIPLEAIRIERKWSDFFGGVMAYRPRQVDGIGARLSPEYTDEEARRVYDGNGFSQDFLFSPVLTLDFSHVTQLDCPLILFAGRHDRTVNSEVARQWFDRVRAPAKSFVWFENSAHEIMVEEPGKFLLSLVQEARPLAARVGDAAP
ncbi:alpha/beta fold hydrolase [Sphingosinicella sp. BN140058]|uniref:alpha/beta fold hydrolase n=1 Tax=Sphingosinicella sp. BN140058 TaxID=1892855 RepID=UPI001011EE4E|nr:alpha/beta fold hydrolase [Sphingosinicella sp. BN140058]QAY75854.1 alpha/beta fold hydrolase [Sphingosinicella sp. BN140058]